MSRLWVVAAVVSMLAFSACGGSDEEKPSSFCPGGEDTMYLIRDAEGNRYCIPEKDEGKALCVIEPVDFNPCTSGCSPNTVLAVHYHPWIDGSSSTICQCLSPEEAESCNGLIDAP